MRSFEYKDNTSNKFWRIERYENEVNVSFGRIGTKGQIKHKVFDTEDDAIQEENKLINQKLQKGYIEVENPTGTAPSTPHSEIQKLLTSTNLKVDLFNYLKPIFTQSEACEVYLHRLVDNVQSITMEGDNLKFFSEDDEGEEFDVTLSAPLTSKITDAIPKSMAEFCQVHNGVEWSDYLGAGFWGLYDDGQGISEGGWDPSYLEEAAEDNEDFLQGLNDNGYDLGDVDGPFDYGQNWLILNPADLNDLGEPMLYFVSHGDCEAVEVKAARGLKWGPIVLRVMVEKIMGDTDFKEIYD